VLHVPTEEPLGDHGTDYCGYCHNFGHRAGNDYPNEPMADEPHDASSINGTRCAKQLATMSNNLVLLGSQRYSGHPERPVGSPSLRTSSSERPKPTATSASAGWPGRGGRPDDRRPHGPHDRQSLAASRITSRRATTTPPPVRVHP
jgi:hypothetical protein